MSCCHLPVSCRSLYDRFGSAGSCKPHTHARTNNGDDNGEWRRLHNEELHSLYRPPNIVRVIKSRRLKWAGHVARMEEGRSALKFLTDKPTGKRPLGRPRRRWEDNIRVDLKEIGINTTQVKDYW